MMKNLIIVVCLMLVAQLAICQVPASFNYQGIAGNAEGETLKNSPLGLKISIIEDEMNAPAVYQEIINTTTTSIGHFSVKVGTGDIELGSFDDIDWMAEAHFLRIEMDPAGGTNYSVDFIAPLTAVPFAYVVNTANNTPQGRQGADGELGLQGQQGIQGPQGPDGGSGSQGPQGPRGARGPDGPPGGFGPQGSQGEKGDTGLTGLDGERGIEGPQGRQGPQGPQGPQGDQGAQGPQGQEGPRGPAAQPTNVSGPIGEMGPPGIPGGPQGPQGDQGDAGLPGTDGEPGEEGPSGIRFYDDSDFNLTSVVPQNPTEGQLYIDDGTNRTDNKPGFRVYNGFAWFDL